MYIAKEEKAVLLFLFFFSPGVSKSNAGSKKSPGGKGAFTITIIPTWKCDVNRCALFFFFHAKDTKKKKPNVKDLCFVDLFMSGTSLCCFFST